MRPWTVLFLVSNEHRHIDLRHGHRHVGAFSKGSVAYSLVRSVDPVVGWLVGWLHSWFRSCLACLSTEEIRKQMITVRSASGHQLRSKLIAFEV